MHAAGRKAEATEQGLGGGEHALDPGRYPVPVEPTQGHQVTALGFQGAAQMRAEPRQRFAIGRLESQHHAGEHFADSVRAELGQ
jgi:hypothetical protein